MNGLFLIGWASISGSGAMRPPPAFGSMYITDCVILPLLGVPNRPSFSLLIGKSIEYHTLHRALCILSEEFGSGGTIRTNSRSSRCAALLAVWQVSRICLACESENFYSGQLRRIFARARIQVDKSCLTCRGGGCSGSMSKVIRCLVSE